VTSPEDQFGSYARLTRDPRFRYRPELPLTVR
jgi:hypothetical protein